MSQQINLFNPIFLQQKKIFGALPMAEALGAIVLGTLLMTWYASRNVDQLAQRAEHGKLQLVERERRLVEANRQFAPRAQSPTLAADLAQAEAELASLHRVADFLQQGALGNSAGYAEYFRALARQKLDGLWLTGVTIAGSGSGSGSGSGAGTGTSAGTGTEIGVQGRAMQPALITQYIGRLTAERVMRGKTFASLDIARPDVAGITSAASATGLAADPAAQAAGVTTAPYVQFSLQTTGVQAR